MSRLLENGKPYAQRDYPRFLEEMNKLTTAHLAGCPEYRRLFPDFRLLAPDQAGSVFSFEETPPMVPRHLSARHS